MLDYLRIMLNARLAKMDERGASAVEYGLLIAGIAALIVVVVFAFGGVIKNIFSNTCKSVGQQRLRQLLKPELDTVEWPRTSGPRPLVCSGWRPAARPRLDRPVARTPRQCPVPD